MTQEDKTAELDRLNRMLRAREGRSGYTQNVAAIKAEISRIEAEPVE